MNFFFQGEFFSRVAKCFFCVLSSPCGLALFGDAGDKISFDIDRKTAGRQVSDYKKTFFRILGLRLNEKSLFRCNVGLRQMDCKSSSAVRHCEQGPMSLGSSASFRRIVPFRDTSTMESEIPSFRDAKPHESWELVPLDELSLPGILQLRNRRFLVSGMRSRSNLCWHLVIARSVATWQSCQRERIASTLRV